MTTVMPNISAAIIDGKRHDNHGVRVALLRYHAIGIAIIASKTDSGFIEFKYWRI